MALHPLRKRPGFHFQFVSWPPTHDATTGHSDADTAEVGAGITGAGSQETNLRAAYAGDMAEFNAR